MKGVGEVPRINRIIRAKSDKSSSIWPAPDTLAECRAACKTASRSKLVDTRRKLELAPSPKEKRERIAGDELGFEIDSELNWRFREAVRCGLSAIEVRQWMEIVGAPWVNALWRARMPADDANVHAINGTDRK